MAENSEQPEVALSVDGSSEDAPSSKADHENSPAGDTATDTAEEAREDSSDSNEQVADGTAGDQEASTVTDATTGVVEGFSRRFLNEKWIGRYDATQEYVEFHNNEWRPLSSDDLEFIQQLWYEQEAAETQVVNGVKMKWNAAKQEWERVEEPVDEDFIATYQATYGVPYDYSKLDEERKAAELERAKNNKSAEKKEKKAKATTEAQGWVDMEEKVHAVYVSNLPTDITMDEFKEFMSKCGVIQPDARTNKPKLKLYVDEQGQLKGDGRCCYIKKESVDLALSILDGYLLKGKEVHVEKAHFELKGEFDPTKKRKKLTNAQKKRYMENQNKIFEWRPEKPRNYRPLSDCTVVIKNLFTLEMMARNAALLLDLKEEVQESCLKYGVVKKVVVYDNNPEGVVTVTFETTDSSDMAVKMLNGRLVDGRRLEVALWDGKTKYKVEESEEDRKRRLAAWQDYIKGDSDDDDGDAKKEKVTDEKKKEEEENVNQEEAGTTPEKRPKLDDNPQ
uniref:17S U2 SnRNP complex component HTATSF1 n=1 Tax=Haemonchus contortus TaxID=6289 RepID=W6NC37_HAECO